jgi:ATP-dependent Clp protease ATP-binding subunit ClpC
MFERFTDRARRVVVLAQEESRLFNHDYIGTEHILLGLIHEGEGVAATTLESLGISLDAVRSEVEEMIGHGKSPARGHIPFTPRAKKVLELSLREALQLGHNYIGTEHILLGLIREGEGVAAQVLQKLGLSLDAARREIIELLEVEGSPEQESKARMTPAERLELVRRLTERGRRVRIAAKELADALADQSVTEEDVYLGLLVSPGRLLTLEGMAADAENLRARMKDRRTEEPPSGDEAPESSEEPPAE